MLTFNSLWDFDRLLNLYEYVEGGSDLKITVLGTQSDFSAKAGLHISKIFYYSGPSRAAT